MRLQKTKTIEVCEEVDSRLSFVDDVWVGRLLPADYDVRLATLDDFGLVTSSNKASS